MDRSTKVLVAGHRGLIGSAFVRRLRADGYQNVIVRTHAELDLADEKQVRAFFEVSRPQVVVMAAGKVGGIRENQTHPAEFITSNLRIQLSVFAAAHRVSASKMLFFASSCMYPRDCPQPMAERLLLTGKPEETSLPYAISKLAGVHMCLAFNRQHGSTLFIPVIPNSAFGPNDNFDPASAHVLSALIARFHHAKISGAARVALWGTGRPRREFIHADDIADACLFLLDSELSPDSLPVNIGTGADCSIRELAELVARVVGFTGRIEWDPSRPDGAPQKLLDSSRLRKLGWSGPKITLADGIRSTYEWFLSRKRETISG